MGEDTPLPASYLKTFGDFQPARLAEIGIAPYGAQLWPGMAALNLGFYRDAMGNLFIGVNDAQLHRHDRWLFTKPAGQWSQWYHADSDTPRPYPLQDSVSLRLLRLQDKLDEQPARELWQWYRLPVGLTEAFLAASRSGRFTPEDLHDLLLHTDAWISRHPAYAGMPRELVLRMQGLGSELVRFALAR